MSTFYLYKPCNPYGITLGTVSASQTEGCLPLNRSLESYPIVPPTSTDRCTPTCVCVPGCSFQLILIYVVSSAYKVNNSPQIGSSLFAESWYAPDQSKGVPSWVLVRRAGTICWADLESTSSHSIIMRFTSLVPTGVKGRFYHALGITQSCLVDCFT